MMEPEYKRFAVVLKKHRRKLNISQNLLAKELGISRVSVAKYESGSQRIALHIAVKISRFLKFDLNQFAVDGPTIDEYRKELKTKKLMKLKEEIKRLEDETF